jgi:putative phage-type endonuclease
MKTHNLTQGSPEWLAYRSTHFNASDAPAMLCVSPYKTRTELLHELHTGLSPEIDAATQRRFDAGHAAEAAARPLAESEIGEDLYQIVGSLEIDGLPLSASFDGLTMAEDIVWEHKLMNVNLAESLADGVIPDSYHPQLEQQLMVSGAGKALFMATSPDRTAME